MKKLFFILLFLNTTLFSSPLTLKELHAYTQRHPELPSPDNLDFFIPNYATFYREFEPSFIKKIIPFWQTSLPLINKLKPLITQVSLQRKQTKALESQVARLQCSSPADAIIWGNLHGAFHSLVRDLIFLQSKGIINNTLTITKPKVYFIFNGNAVSRSPYSIETLIVILQLMKNNPDKVFYIQGTDEKDWLNYNLIQELKIKNKLSEQELSTETNDSIVGQINHFFKTLPIALYINTEQNPYDVIRIAPVSNTALNENDFGDLFEPSKQSLALYTITKQKPTPQKVTIKANIVSTIKNVTKPFYGINLLLDQDYGAPNWTVFSSPSLAFQKLYHFYYDAFAVLHITVPLIESTLLLYYQDSRKPAGFSTLEPKNVALDSRKKKRDIVIGSSLALLSGVPAMGNKVKTGIEARIKEQNAQGGINGHYLKLIIFNDNYTPFLARQNIEKFINTIPADVILLPVGSPTLASYIDYIKNNKALVLFPVTGGPQFRGEDLTGLVHFRASYPDEVQALVKYVIQKYNPQNFAFFYQNDAYGTGPFEAAKKVLEEHNISPPLALPYARGATNFSAQIKKIKESEPDAIGFFSTARATEEFIRQLGVDFLANKKLFGVSFLGSPSFKKFAQKHGLEVLFGAVVPNPHISQLPIVKEYRQAMDTYGKHYDVYSLEAFITTDLLITVLSSIPEPITSEKIVKKFESLKDFNHKGLELSFNPASRSLAKYVWIESDSSKDWERINL